MLVLSRKAKESIVINDDITITINRIKGDAVSIGITAPRTVAVHRREVYDIIQAEKQNAETMECPGSNGKTTTTTKSTP